MKIYICSSKDDRPAVKSRIKSVLVPLSLHLVKCVVYEDSLNCLDQWIKEISAYFATINNLKIHTKTRKFTLNQYVEMYEELCGDDLSSCEAIIDVFKFDNRRSEDYPDFETTEEIVRNFNELNLKIIDEVPPPLPATYTCKYLYKVRIPKLTK